MNIAVKTASGKYIVRPDTTWEKDNEDLYLPEFVNKLSYTPVLFARITKPGRSIGRNFASRYYEGVNYGVLLYPEDMIDGSETGFACASCLDHTSFLPFPVYNNATLGQGNVCELFASKEGENEELLFTHDGANASMIEEAIAEATRFIYIRTGDVIAIELSERKALCEREDGKLKLRGTYCNNFLLDFNIIF